MTKLARFILFFLVLGMATACEKENPPEEENPDDSLIQEETKSENISASAGGAIELTSGVKLEVPAGALSSDAAISVETIDPYDWSNEFIIPKELKGTKISAVVRCTPEGTTFNSAVLVTIPYVPELFPDDLPLDSLLVVSCSSGYIDSHPFTLDQSNNVVIAQTSHFSDFVIIANRNILVDRGRIYNTVVIGEQVWMAENLAYLPEVSPLTDSSSSLPFYYVYGYNGTSVEEAKSTSNYFTYGVHYNWPAAMEASPEGWHLPTDDEWKQLELFLGMSQEHVDSHHGEILHRGTDEGTRLKATSGWSNVGNDSGNGTDEYGFAALPGGYANVIQQEFDKMGSSARFWTASPVEEWDAQWTRGISRINPDGISRLGGTGNAKMGYSVRCIKDQ